MADNVMVERVARAIVAADEQNGGPPWDYIAGLGKHALAFRMDQARAAISAMREPTGEMLDALGNALYDAETDSGCPDHWGTLRKSWPAMIDAALAEGNERNANTVAE